MYNPDLMKPPVDEQHFWEMTEQNLEAARHVLQDHPLESREDAMTSRLRSIDADGKLYLPGLTLIAYRRGSEEMDQRDFYYYEGRKILPRVQELVRARDLSVEFTQLWGVLQCCHGYIASYLFDDGNNFAQNHGALANAEAISVELQRTWVARILRREIEGGKSRKEAERAVVRVAGDFIQRDGHGEAFPADWFAAVLRDDGGLKTTYGKAQMPGRRLSEWADRDEIELPPIDSL